MRENNPDKERFCQDYIYIDLGFCRPRGIEPTTSETDESILNHSAKEIRPKGKLAVLQ